MASTRTIFELGDGVQQRGGVNLFVRVRLELGRMAASTVWFIGGRSPYNRFIVCGVAVGAQHTAIVRFVRSRHVGIGGRRFPRSRAVARITRARGDKVSCCFS